MELLLNLGWLLVCVGLACTALRRRNTQTVRNSAVIVVAVIVLSAVLFPAISMTDDLHAAIVMADDGSSQHHKNFAAQHSVLAVAILAAVVTFIVPKAHPWSSRVDESATAFVRAGFCSVHSLRAPPALNV